MEIRLIWRVLLFVLCVDGGLAEQVVYSAKLVHRFSDEAKAHRGVRLLKVGAGVAGGVGFWPQRRSSEYYRRLLSSDVQRQTLKLNSQFQFLYPSEGSTTLPLGNDFGWLHYMWIDVGTPKVSFLVALDAGSDLFWVPCDCVQCAPLSANYYSSLVCRRSFPMIHFLQNPRFELTFLLHAAYSHMRKWNDLQMLPCSDQSSNFMIIKHLYDEINSTYVGGNFDKSTYWLPFTDNMPLPSINKHMYFWTLSSSVDIRCSLLFGASIMQDKDLSEYNPTGSSTSKSLSCSHQLCESGPNCSNPTQNCPYTINYYSDDTSTSGFLVQDVLHLVGGHPDASNKSVKAPVVIGCGSKQTGGYLNGVAPDGLLGLGLGEISVPSFLAKAGYIRNSFSLCFNEDDSGRLFFGDQGIAAQQTTPFLPLHGKNLTYIVGVDACCIGSSCLDHTNFQMLVDSGTSFTFVPGQIYERVVDEFDRQVNASKSSFEGYPWQYCYKSNSQGVPTVPSLTLKFATSNNFVVKNPVFVIYGTQGAVGFCLAVQPTDGDIGTIGQNFMTGYQIVFDREKYKLGWSHSNCQDLPLPINQSGNSNSSNSLPTTEQQSAPNGHAVPPAVAGRTPSKSSTKCCPSCLVMLFLLLLMSHIS